MRTHYTSLCSLFTVIAIAGCSDSGEGTDDDASSIIPGGSSGAMPTDGPVGSGDPTSPEQAPGTASPQPTQPRPEEPGPVPSGDPGPAPGDTSPTPGGGGMPSQPMGGSGGMPEPAGGNGPGPASGGTGGSDAPIGGTGGQVSQSGGAAGNPANGGSPAMEDPFGPDLEGECTASQGANSNASGSGPYDVVVETNSDSGINEGTIFRPADLGGEELFPIFVWGEGGCSQDGLSNQTAMAEIASHGYFVVADGTPGGNSSRPQQADDIAGMGEPLLAYIDWAIEQNAKPCSEYYHALDRNKVASNGFSCGGLMSTGTSGDPRITTWGSTSSGTFSPNQALYDAVHTPVLIIEGGPSDIAYENGLRDYDNISALGWPIMWFSKDIGHGGDLFSAGGGDFTKINLAWLNWWLKGDESLTGKGLLVGDGCTYCTDSEWEVESANLP